MTYFLTWYNPVSNLSETSWWQTLWQSFMQIGWNQCLLESTRFFKIWPNDLVFYPTWPTFKFVLFSFRHIHEYCIKTVPSRMYTWFSKIWSCDLLFDPMWPSFKLDLDFMEINIITKFHKIWIKTVPFRVYTSFFSQDLTQRHLIHSSVDSLKLRLPSFA